MANQKKDCKFCGDGDMLIFPLRYAAMYSETGMMMSQLSAAPTLGAKVSDIKLSTKYTMYTTRVMRRGFLYTLIQYEGQAANLWQAYIVTKDAKLYSFDVDEPPPVGPPQFSCDPYECGVNASMIKIKDAKKATKVWMLFTPNPLTKIMLGHIKAKPDSYAAMQSFSPAEWLNGQKTQPHSLQAEQLEKHVAEMQDGAPPIRDALYDSLFPPFMDVFEKGPGDALKRTETLRADAAFLRNLQKKLQEKEHPAFVLYDAIGITQELNAWRNRGTELFYNWLTIKGGKGNLTNDHKLHMLGQIDGLKDFMRDKVKRDPKVIKEAKENVDYVSQLENSKGTPPTQEWIDNEYEKFFWEKSKYEWYELVDGCLDTDYIEEFRKSCDEIDVYCKKVMNDNHADHLVWLKSQQLNDALAVYDSTLAVDNTNDENNDMAALSGMAFQDQIGMAIVGMTTTAQGQALADEWIKDFSFQDDGKNYLLRAYCCNQVVVMQAMRAALYEGETQAPALENIEAFADWYNKQYGFNTQENSQAANTQTASQPAAQQSSTLEGGSSSVGKVKDVVKGFDRIIKALGESRNSWWFSHSLDGKAAAVLGIFTERTFNLVKSDMRLARGMASVLSAPLGNITIKNYNVMFPNAPITSTSVEASQLRAGAKHGLKNWTPANWESTPNAAGGTYLRFQTGTVLLALESINLFFRAKRENKDTRAYFELTAALFAVTAAGAELVGYGFRALQRIRLRPADIKNFKKFAPDLHGVALGHTVKGARIAYGGLKVFSGSFALSAGLFGAGLDLHNAATTLTKAIKGENIGYNVTLTGLYFVRSLGQVYLSWLSFNISFSETAAFFKFLADLAEAGSKKQAFYTWAHGRAVILDTGAKMRLPAGMAVQAGAGRAVMYVKAAQWGWFLIGISAVIYVMELANPDELKKYFLSSCFRAEGTLRTGVRNLLFGAPIYHVNPEAETEALKKAFNEAFNIKDEPQAPSNNK